MWSLLKAQVSLPRRSIFMFLDVPTFKLWVIIIVLSTDRPELIPPSAHTTKKLSCFCRIITVKIL